MITPKSMARCARSIVESMNLKPGDSVVIRGGVHSQKLLEDIAYECYRIGALPMIISNSDEYMTRVMGGISTSTLGRTPAHLLGALGGADCIITIDPIDDPSIMSKFPRKKTEARSRANVPLLKVLDGEGGKSGKKWCFAGWPTRKQADFYGVDYDLFEKFIVGGIGVPIKALRERCENLAGLLEGATHIAVTDPEGTEFHLKIAGRRRNLDDGFVSDEDVEVNDKGNNLPAGEVFLAPHETWGSGRIFCPVARDPFTGKYIESAELVFEKGKLDLDRTKAAKGGDEIVRSFKQCLKVDQQTRKRIRTLNLAEIGIGCNPRITKVIGYVLTDEKIIGSAHVAFGDNFTYGGTSRSVMHWDFVTIPRVTMVARIDDGSERVVIDGGRIRKG